MLNLSIIIITYNSKGFITECLESIKRYTTGLEYEVIIIDNASTDNSYQLAKKFVFNSHELRVIENSSNLGFAAANNQGMKIARGRYILLLNPDTRLLENSLLKMISFMDKHLDVGISSCKLINSDGSLQPTGGFHPTLWRVFLWSTLLDDVPLISNLFGSYHPHFSSSLYKEVNKIDWVTGAFFLTRREVLDKVGMMDEDFFLYVEELEYCWRTKLKGWEIYYVPITKILHHGGASGTREETIWREFTGLKILYQKYFSLLHLLLLRLFLFIGSLVRILVFGMINPGKAKLYVNAVKKI